MEFGKQQGEALMRVQGWLNTPNAPQVFRLFGYAGTGKTTLAMEIARMVRGRVQFAAYTGKASLVLRSKGCLNASTIHSLIYKPEDGPDNKPIFVINPESPLAAAMLVIIDEVSMVAEDLAADLLSFGVRVLVLGDPAQLPPVKGGGYFTNCEPDVMLTDIHRQALDNPIVAMSMRVREGKELELGQFGDSKVILRKDLQPGEVMAADQVLCGLNNTRRGLNQKFRTSFGFEEDYPHHGDRLVCLKNDRKRQLYNGGLWVADNPILDKRIIAMRVRSTDVGGAIGLVEVSVPIEYFHGTEEALPYHLKRALDAFDFGYALTVHKCIHPDTLVETIEGLLPIKLIAPTGVAATPDGPLPYRNKVANPPMQAIKIGCESGYAITVTCDHKAEIRRSGDFEMIEARDLAIGDWMRLRLGATIDIMPLAKLPPLPDGDIRSVAHPVPIECTPWVAEFLGLMVADGTVYKKGFRLLKRHIDVVERFGELCATMFGQRGKAVGWNNATGYEVNSTRLVGWLKLIGGLEPNKKNVPECILRSPPAIQAHFLRGLFEDGTVNSKDDVIDHVEWQTVSAEMCSIVQTMLLRFGVVASMARYRDQWRLSIYSSSIRKFAQTIGFVCATKNSLLQGKISENRRSRIPLTGNEFQLICEKISVDQSTIGSFRTTGYISRAIAEDLLRRSNLPFLHELLNWHYVRVTSLEALMCESMCIEVPIGHRFLQNGFPHGNSQGSQWNHVMLFDESMVFREHRARHLYTGITRAAEKITIVI